MSKKIEETTSVCRKWKIDDLTDDEEVNENHSEKIKPKAFEKFMAQRPISMPPPTLIPTQEVKSSSKIQDIINLNNDESEEIKTKIFQKSFTQPSRLSPPVPILSQKFDSSQPQTIIDLTDDDDDFIQTPSSRAKKKFKST